nr:hypothetical protein KPHV_02570 [Kitasatospora purpeofusca]
MGTDQDPSGRWDATARATAADSAARARRSSTGPPSPAANIRPPSSLASAPRANVPNPGAGL